MKENSGSQDQIWAAYGGFNSIEFKKNHEFNVKKLTLTTSKINKLKVQEGLCRKNTGC